MSTCCGEHNINAKTLHEMNNPNSGPQSLAAIQLAEGAKDLWVNPSLGPCILSICMYNVRTLKVAEE